MPGSDPHVGKNKAAQLLRREGHREWEELKAWGSGLTRIPEIAPPGTGGDQAWGLAVGMPRKEEIKEACGQVPAGQRAMWACGGVAKKHGEKQHWV